MGRRLGIISGVGSGRSYLKLGPRFGADRYRPEGFGEPEPIVAPTPTEEEAGSDFHDEEYEYEEDDDEGDDGKQGIGEGENTISQTQPSTKP